MSCYGWDDIAKDRRPIDHFCYSCLLLPKEKALNDWMPNLVKCRNILKYLKAQKFAVPVDDNGLAEALRKLHILDGLCLVLLVDTSSRVQRRSEGLDGKPYHADAAQKQAHQEKPCWSNLGKQLRQWLGRVCESIGQHLPSCKFPTSFIPATKHLTGL